jgi:hypothetical protein
MLKCNVYVCKREEAVKGTSSPSLMCNPNRPKYSQTFLYEMQYSDLFLRIMMEYKHVSYQAQNYKISMIHKNRFLVIEHKYIYKYISTLFLQRNTS